MSTLPSAQELLGVTSGTSSGVSEGTNALQGTTNTSLGEHAFNQTMNSGIMSGLAINSPVPSSGLTGSSSSLTETSGSLGQTSILSGSALPSTSAASGQSNLASLLAGVSGANLPSAMNVKGVETPWMSETELVTGKVPAIISSDVDLGIDNEVSTVVELQDKSASDRADSASARECHRLVGFFPRRNCCRHQ